MQREGPDEEYWADCPECKSLDGVVSVGRTHFAYCLQHRKRWCIGDNLFSSWRGQTREEQLALAQVMYDPDGNLRPGWETVFPYEKEETDAA